MGKLGFEMLYFGFFVGFSFIESGVDNVGGSWDLWRKKMAIWLKKWGSQLLTPDLEKGRQRDCYNIYEPGTNWR